MLSWPFTTSRLNASQPPVPVCHLVKDVSGCDTFRATRVPGTWASSLPKPVPGLWLEGTWFCVAFSILATGPSYLVALLSSAEAFLSTRARSLPCPEPRCGQGPRSDCPTAVARLRPGAGSLSPGRMQQVPGPYISPSPGLLPRGLALSFCHSSSLPAFSFFASWVSFPITRFIQLSESRTRS